MQSLDCMPASLASEGVIRQSRLNLARRCVWRLCRWRNQKGKISDMDELEAKKAQLLEKLDIKREAAFEKDLILEELASLSTRLHESAAAGWTETS